MLRQGGAGEVGERLTPVPRRLERGHGLGRSRGGVRLRAPCRLALSEHGARGRKRTDCAGAGRGASRSQGRARRRRQARGADLVLRGHRRMPAPKDRTAVFTEADWTNLNDPTVQPDPKSKTIAERAAWDFIAREGHQLELAVVNPVGVFGPVLGPEIQPRSCSSVVFWTALYRAALISRSARSMSATSPICPQRMTDPAARSERFLAIGGDFLSVRQIAQMLGGRRGDRARGSDPLLAQLAHARSRAV